jgi:hypothetical protein
MKAPDAVFRVQSAGPLRAADEDPDDTAPRRRAAAAYHLPIRHADV